MFRMAQVAPCAGPTTRSPVRAETTPQPQRLSGPRGVVWLWENLAREPFRVFFPLAVATGLLGVAVWPLHFGGILESYPGPAHTRLMGQGFFGAFIFGFLGTALPRLLGTAPFRRWQIGLSLVLFLAFAGANLGGATLVGDACFFSLLALFLGSAAVKVSRRRDVPPPGFILVGLAFLCGLAGTFVGALSHYRELDPSWLVLRPLLAYQGFVLLPVLGVGAFILPRFLGRPSRHDWEPSLRPPPGWWKECWLAAGVGLIIVATFFMEIKGWFRASHALRFAAAGWYLWRTLPLWRTPQIHLPLAWPLRSGLIMILLGLLAVAVWPQYRVGWLHIFLVGGLGVVTMLVATRVVYGHSGHGARLREKNRWMPWAIGLIVLGMATRISGDMLPRIMISHYNYGALCWAMGMGLWAWKVLPKVLVEDPD